MKPTATLHLQDCIAGMHERLAADSIDLCVTSIPFEELFTYSGKLEDVGNNGSTIDPRVGRFALNLRFWAAALYRVMKPGCCVAIHIQQLLAYKNQHGFMGRRDFRGAVIDTVAAVGFDWTGEFAIAKNPQAMASRLNLHCLMFQTGKSNGRALAPAPNDYVLKFQKPGEAAPCPVLRDLSENPSGQVTTDEWIRDACGIWSDIDEFDILDGRRNHKEDEHEKHVCPLQLEVIRRCVKLWTMPGETVLDPFMGIGSTAVVAIEQGRNAVGFELKESYHAASLDNVKKQEAKMRENEQDLFTMAGKEAA